MPANQAYPVRVITEADRAWAWAALSSSDIGTTTGERALAVVRDAQYHALQKCVECACFWSDVADRLHELDAAAVSRQGL